MIWQAVERDVLLSSSTASNFMQRWTCALVEPQLPGYLHYVGTLKVCGVNHRSAETAQQHARQIQRAYDRLACCRPQPSADPPQLTYDEIAEFHDRRLNMWRYP